jgi:hypothetical protein
VASPGCDCAVLPVRNRGEIPRTGNVWTSQCAPESKNISRSSPALGLTTISTPNEGRTGTMGFIIIMKRGFREGKKLNPVSGKGLLNYPSFQTP